MSEVYMHQDGQETTERAPTYPIVIVHTIKDRVYTTIPFVPEDASLSNIDTNEALKSAGEVVEMAKDDDGRLTIPMRSKVTPIKKWRWFSTDTNFLRSPFFFESTLSNI